MFFDWIVSRLDFILFIRKLKYFALEYVKRFRSANHYSLKKKSSNNHLIDILISYLKSNYFNDSFCQYSKRDYLMKSYNEVFMLNTNQNSTFDFSLLCRPKDRSATEFFLKNQILAVDNRLYSSYASKLIHGSTGQSFTHTNKPISIYIDYRVWYFFQFEFFQFLRL